MNRLPWESLSDPNFSQTVPRPEQPSTGRQVTIIVEASISRDKRLKMPDLGVVGCLRPPLSPIAVRRQQKAQSVLAA
jgi:hypothetical protein